MKLEFRAVQPNGLLVYMADTVNSNPRHYFCLYLHNGHVVMSMVTDSITSRQDPSPTKNIRLRFKYDDGRWWKVRTVG